MNQSNYWFFVYFFLFFGSQSLGTIVLRLFKLINFNPCELIIHFGDKCFNTHPFLVLLTICLLDIHRFPVLLTIRLLDAHQFPVSLTIRLLDIHQFPVLLTGPAKQGTRIELKKRVVKRGPTRTKFRNEQVPSGSRPWTNRSKEAVLRFRNEQDLLKSRPWTNRSKEAVLRFRNEQHLLGSRPLTNRSKEEVLRFRDEQVPLAVRNLFVPSGTIRKIS